MQILKKVSYLPLPCWLTQSNCCAPVTSEADFAEGQEQRQGREKDWGDEGGRERGVVCLA